MDTIDAMINKKELIAYFRKEANMITTEEGVELALHGDNLIEVSLMLRNALNIKVKGFYPMLQLHIEFKDFKLFQKVMKVKELGDMNKISLADMMWLYAAGMVQLYVAK